MSEQFTDPYANPPQPQAPTPQPKRRWWLSRPAIGVAALLVGIGIGAGGGGDSTPAAVSTPTVTATYTEPASTVTVTAAPKATRAAAAKPTKEAGSREPSEAAFKKALDCDQVIPRSQWLPESGGGENYEAAIGCGYDSGAFVAAMKTSDASTAQVAKTLMAASDGMEDYSFDVKGTWVLGASDELTLATAKAAYDVAKNAS
ncbi:hypothetical protein DUY81_13810 [Acidipropionibacterium acidipropionici]|uniref:Uncharacterized protein n=1 Tax=Acidipropionibacterium acidipropionici TaxID=1748 RepID=A0AAC9FCG0_9ACTN|nr:hypothetical protein [Acidipropionibacterium acidipropionici]AMS06493.1 hypothetical protein AXH35_14555 [Acidipropionibacterium acidipropionici]AOZ47940.1 hypothetical protein A8L58_16010 [Acidipropionibacterium acidipropionici]AZP38713.1 hypothetical protein DUY81_13810 [Acidipropionibacterium acidipropionici]